MIHILQQFQMNIGYEYIYGESEETFYQKALQCCGSIVGCFKGWTPCIGCFCCCCQSPYVQIQQGSKGLHLRYQKYVKTMNPGLVYINPVTESILQIDCRITVIPMPIQRLMTKDNISISVQSCVYYHIKDPHLAYFRLGQLEPALMKICGGIIKNSIATFTFQQLLEKKAEITTDIEHQVGPIIQNWGIQINNICLKNFGISAELEKQLVSAPIARRNAESKIINAQAQVQIAKLLGDRSKILDSKTAIQVRYLQTLKGLARNNNSKMIYRSC